MDQGRFALIFSFLFLHSVCHAQQTAESLNQAFNLELFSSSPLWEQSAETLADNLELPAESQTKTLSSYRAYPKANMKVLGTRPYTISLHAENDQPTDIAIFFANKGDYNNIYRIQKQAALATGKQRADLRQQLKKALRGLPAAIRDEENRLQETLTLALGEPSRERIGDSRSTKETVQRWDWQGHSILLASKPDEYIAVRILPTSRLDTANENADQTRSEFKQMLSERVIKRDNGDVIITEIPMVDQGPKGYCVPATGERFLRYMGISADMYTLAMAGETDIGGGSYTKDIVKVMNELARPSGQKVGKLSPSLRMSNISREIDKGHPIIWAIFVDPELDDNLTMRAKQRASTEDPEIWQKALKNYQKNLGRIRPSKENGHVCMIIGYNETTEELAISDSWGPEFEERWISLKEADMITQNEMYVID